VKEVTSEGGEERRRNILPIECRVSRAKIARVTVRRRKKIGSWESRFRPKPFVPLPPVALPLVRAVSAIRRVHKLN
jgi:hypothetical protein